MTTNLPPEPVQPAELVECIYCQRRFASNRIEIHENICKKSSTTLKRNCSASEKIKEGDENNANKHVHATNWRQRHEEFLKKIKQSKCPGSEKDKDPNSAECVALEAEQT